MPGPLLVHVETPPLRILLLLVVHILLKAICLASSADYLTPFAIAPLPQNIFAQAASSRRITTSFTLIILLFDAMQIVPSSKQSMSTTQPSAQRPQPLALPLSPPWIKPDTKSRHLLLPPMHSFRRRTSFSVSQWLRIMPL